MIDYRHPLAVKIRKQMVEAIAEHDLIQANDKVMVCVSGGKDSSVLLALLAEVKRRAPFPFEVEAVMLDQKQPGFSADQFTEWVKNQVGVKFTIVERDTYSIVKEKSTSKIYCSMCSRLRRGILYGYAVENGFTKMALGHHRDDSAETLLLNLFYSGKLQAMPPKFQSDDGRNVVIRPFYAIAEDDIQQIAQAWNIPIMPCNLCGSQDGLKRQKIKRLISDLEESIPDIRNSMATAITNVRISHLADGRVWDFKKLSDQEKASAYSAEADQDFMI